MGQIREEVIQSWLDAVEKSRATGPVRERIIKAGEFLLKRGRASPAKVPEFLKAFDFSKDIVVIEKMPAGVYVQYKQKHTGHWFTSIGLTQEVCGLADGYRTRALYYPKGSVCALKGTAAGVNDYWSSGMLFDLKKKAIKQGIPLTAKELAILKAKLGKLTSQGGVQYYVPDPEQMKLM